MLAAALATTLLAAAPVQDPVAAEPPSVDGIYPHLAVYNDHPECGIGALVPWAGRLWCVTYAPHMPRGSSDRLYEIDAELRLRARPESVGGTPANRLIHRETDQLVIGPHVIDAEGGVRTIPPELMPGRLTATARHLFEPERKVYYLGMEEELYEVDLVSLEVRELYGTHGIPMSGSHAKGAYTGQGRLAFSNNGEWGWMGRWREHPEDSGDSGALAEWDGERWTLVRRAQFCEVTGPGDLYGNATPDDPLWATGWDAKSALLMLCDGGRWQTFRLPRASRTYDGGHGWFTEWPRIRAIGGGRRLMTLHGTLFDFPGGFRFGATGGIRPLSTTLEMIVDFCAWNGRLVLARNCVSRFDNPLAGQAHSNLAFCDPAELTRLGPLEGDGGVWLAEPLAEGARSDPFLVAGYPRRGLHVAHESDRPLRFTLEVDARGDGEWTEARTLGVGPRGHAFIELPPELDAEWVRLRAEDGGAAVTAWFQLSGDRRPAGDERVFDSLPRVGDEKPRSLGLIRPRGQDLGTLHLAAWTVDAQGLVSEAGYYELGPELELLRVEDPAAHVWLKETARVDGRGFDLDAASVVVTDERGRRWRLPRGAKDDEPGPEGFARAVREVVTERALLACHGTIYELPRPSAGGFAGLRAVCTHGRRIHDFCSWRGLLVLAGQRLGATPDEHALVSDDGRAGLWLGRLDRLWELGAPRGTGGPWKDSAVEPGVPSDPYLVRGFDPRSLELTHDSDRDVSFSVQVDVTGHGDWLPYLELSVPPGLGARHEFPAAFSAAWLRVTADRACRATAWLVYG